MSTVGQLADGLVRRAQTIPGLHCYPVDHPSPDPPAFCVTGPVRWTYDETMDAVWRPVFTCWILVNPADLVRAQQTLYTYLAPSGPRSIPAAIYGDTTLGDVAHDTRVLGGVGPPAQRNTDGGPLLGLTLEVEVTAM
jgi:hypothetical protein